MVDLSSGFIGSAVNRALNEQIRAHIERQDDVESLPLGLEQPIAQRLGLGTGPGESVEEEAALGIVQGDAVD